MVLQRADTASRYTQLDSPQPTAHSPQPTAHGPRPTVHGPQSTPLDEAERPCGTRGGEIDTK